MNDPTHFPYHLNLSKQIPQWFQFISVTKEIIPVQYPMFIDLGDSVKAFKTLNDPIFNQPA